MPWLVEKPPRHECPIPEDWGDHGNGSIWQCDQCGQCWERVRNGTCIRITLTRWERFRLRQGWGL